MEKGRGEHIYFEKKRMVFVLFYSFAFSQNIYCQITLKKIIKLLYFIKGNLRNITLSLIKSNVNGLFACVFFYFK